MIKTILIDDELHCIKALENDLVKFCPEIDVVATCTSAKAGIMAINEHRPELIFLDVEMPVMNGFEMLQLLDSSRIPHVIFSTAYQQFAIKALRASAIDYLLKPIDRVELKQAVDRATRLLSSENDQIRHVDNLLENQKMAVEQQKIALPMRDGYDFIALGDILYCKADGAYTLIVLSNGKTILLSKQLGELEPTFPDHLFARIHHSYLVNLRQISQFKKVDGAYLIMNNGDSLSVSRSKKEQLMQKLGLKS
ncbi:two-component system LytT family response regulator [Pedobacter sp. W3I1]|uniref:LytR/AlgR family response regulator transcription factor n=1 Tax=Pedobacter sp. W3I1 TaxID=3042291 RepID=UPI0027893DB8|nr:response regulator [Pedobacter sp. W3I1]MDQ0640270.1 two-component system LytT family response regulator [Pedobacter sp. W3I1]